MKIKGIIDISTTEWKDNVSMVIFFHGCPLNCFGCQNYGEEYIETSVSDICVKMMENKLVDSVVISGGEPLEQLGYLSEILRFAKRLGLKTAIETSGFYPERLEYLIKEKYLDKVFLDIKGSIKHTRTQSSFISSIECLKFSKEIDMELRTTIFSSFPDIYTIVDAIKPYHINVLQQGCPENSKDVPQDEKLTREELITIAKKYEIKTIRTSTHGEENI